MKNLKRFSQKWIESIIDYQWFVLKSVKSERSYSEFINDLESDGNVKKSKFYRWAASFLLLVSLTYACTLPVSTSEEKGFALTGSSSAPAENIIDVLLKWIPTEDQIHLLNIKGTSETSIFAVFEGRSRSEMNGILEQLENQIALHNFSINPIVARKEASIMALTLRNFNIPVSGSWDLVTVRKSIETVQLNNPDSTNIDFRFHVNQEGSEYIQLSGISSKKQGYRLIESIVRMNSQIDSSSLGDSLQINRELRKRY